MVAFGTRILGCWPLTRLTSDYVACRAGTRRVPGRFGTHWYTEERSFQNLSCPQRKSAHGAHHQL